MSLIGVECWADKYFFGRLIENRTLIRKEKNDIEVINSVVTRSKGNFSIGIIDVDKNKKLPKDFIEIYNDNHTIIFKHKGLVQFLITVGPRQFEHWILRFLTDFGHTIQDFHYDNFDDFMDESKSLRPETKPRFKSVIDFVIGSLTKKENHILAFKRKLGYLIESGYNYNEADFQNIA